MMAAYRKPWIQLITEPEWVMNSTQWLSEYVTDWNIGFIYYELVIYCGLVYEDDVRKVVVCNLTSMELGSNGLGNPACIARVCLHEAELSGGVELLLGSKNPVYMKGLETILDNVFANDQGLPDDLIAYLAELGILYKSSSVLQDTAIYLFQNSFSIYVPVW